MYCFSLALGQSRSGAFFFSIPHTNQKTIRKGELTMWIFLLAIILVVILIKLGALSVLVTVLAFSLKAVIGLVAGIGLLMLYIESRCGK
jgi:hypothetical protein